jgi:hypothetical protein
MTRTAIGLASLLLLLPAQALAGEDDETGRTMGDEVHETHERLEEALDKAFEEAGKRVERAAEEANSGCNNSSLGWRTREKLGCDS